AAFFGGPVANSLSAGGFTDPRSESERAADILAEKFSCSDMQLLVLVTSDRGVNDPSARAVASEVESALTGAEHVGSVMSAWSGPPEQARVFVSTDGKSGLILAGIVGSDADFGPISRDLVDTLPGDRDGVTVRVGGAMTYAEVTEQTER